MSHFNGTSETRIQVFRNGRWRIVPSDSEGYTNLPRSISADAPTDAWIVGGYEGPPPTYTSHTLVERWRGAGWSPYEVPGGDLNAVVALTPSNAWIAGAVFNRSTGAYETLIRHWNGAAWSRVASPNRGTANGDINDLYAITALPNGDLWAVGNYDAESGSGTFIMTRPAG